MDSGAGFAADRRGLGPAHFAGLTSDSGLSKGSGVSPGTHFDAHQKGALPPIGPIGAVGSRKGRTSCHINCLMAPRSAFRRGCRRRSLCVPSSTGWTLRCGRAMFGPFAMMRAARHHHRGDRVFENQLLLIVGFQNHRILVKRANATAQLYAAHQINGDRGLVFASSIEEGVLNILRRLRFHCADLSLIQNQIGTSGHSPSKIKLG